jgi:ATP-dependent DNA ligase
VSPGPSERARNIHKGMRAEANVMGLEGIVSKRLTAPYRSGPSRDWIKVKNLDSPAMVRHREGRW